MPIRTPCLPDRGRLPERLHHRRLDQPQVHIDECTSVLLGKGKRLAVPRLESSVLNRTIAKVTAIDTSISQELDPPTTVDSRFEPPILPKIRIHVVDCRIEGDDGDPLPGCRTETSQARIQESPCELPIPHCDLEMIESLLIHAQSALKRICSAEPGNAR